MAKERNPFARTRLDHQTEVAEDYVELIYRLGQPEPGGPVRTVDLVHALAVSQPTVTKALDRLQREGLVTVIPRQSVALTTAGIALAQASHDRHELILEFLVAIGVPKAQAELDTEGIEHHVSSATLEAFRKFLEK
ncbi:MAG: manganese-binding transcriptional regulator MntR [Armatimonadetes bacterium]|nr:manganese-binding transcriptional regulator MntR [Armatimonadota bacterium]MBS1711927.1 manganese-binding transcriptional regulator MntR [Armatimonadota bacterium]MBX3109519.1 manganese-binding transcriptional regulator MntR [Fimbriimonadaceae bacterium]